MTILDALGLTRGGPAASQQPQPQPAPQAAPQPQSGGGMGNFLSALGPALALLDPRNQQLGVGLMAMQQDRADKTRQQQQLAQNRNETVEWLKNQGVGPEEATYLAKDPVALREWHSRWKNGDKPDWQFRDMHNEDGTQQTYMVDMNTGARNPVGAPWKTDAAPSDVREYEYAQGQGFKGSYMDWKSANRSNTNLTVGPDGTVNFQQGAGKPLTEGQSKDTNYLTRAAGSLPDVDKYGDNLTQLGGFIGDKLPGGWGNFIKSKEYQLGEQAGREWLAPILRKDTGAAITKDEMQQYGSMYLPQPGDAPEVLERKKGARARATEGLKAGMTPDAILRAEDAIGKTAAPTGAGVDWRFNPSTGKLEKVQ